MHDSIVIRIVGDSGDGVQLVGEQLTITAALSGLDVRTLPDFPAEIRAPAGTLAGVSGFQLAMSSQVIFTAGEQLDVLVAMNPAALKHSLESLALGGLLIINEEGFTAKDWEKANSHPDFLATQTEHYQVISVPLISRTLMAVKDLEVTHAQAKKSKNFYILGIVLWLFDLSTAPCEHFIEDKFKSQLKMAQCNRNTLLAGYNYAMTLELSRQAYQFNPLMRETGAYRQVTGVEALSLGLATLCVKTERPLLVAGYPITPASAILHAAAKLADFGVALFQAEDEIAALCACLGASFGGQLAMTCTSGPGFDLKTEALGLAVVTELPVVVVNVQRAGASTGMPTKTGQSDLHQALYGRHGEAPLPVIAASSPNDCFQAILDAFDMAVRYTTPVILLLDAYLVNATELWSIPDVADVKVVNIQQNRSIAPFSRDELDGRSWNVPGTPGYIHQLGGLEKQGEQGRVSYDAENHALMVATRSKKIAGIAKSYAQLVIEGEIDAAMVVVSWGSTYGSVKTAIQHCLEAGLKVAHIHLRHLNPLPLDLGDALRRFRLVLVAELNTGHLCQVIRSQYLVDAQLLSQCNGQPFSVSRLTAAMIEEAKHELV
ncbi:MAG: 2-oxoacid:acceptor oxidoreductase subunit alpha [Gammaproteobacteria bacterium]|nr:2-oxoacid:acceptor oxidoreductase subunit alpha [Gammaproteobacteria bacterium]